jgi:hypothetical protein
MLKLISSCLISWSRTRERDDDYFSLQKKSKHPDRGHHSYLHTSCSLTIQVELRNNLIRLPSQKHLPLGKRGGRWNAMEGHSILLPAFSVF